MEWNRSMYACMHVCVYVCMYACMHVRMHVCMYVYMGDSIHVGTPPNHPIIGVPTFNQYPYTRYIHMYI